MHLAGPRELCVCITYSREAWIEGATGGRGRDSTRNESGLERERDEYDVTARDSLECVYARGEGIEAPGKKFCVCGVCVGMCGCEKILRRGGRGCVTA